MAMAVTLMQPSLAGCSTASQTRLPSGAGAATSVEQPRCSYAPPVPSSRPGPLSTVRHWGSKSGRGYFGGDVSHLSAAVWSLPKGIASGRRPIAVMTAKSPGKSKPVIQFIRGINEQSVPDVRLTRSRDGSNGVANFVFEQPSVFDSSRELGDITGLYMIDFEGVLSSVDVSAKFVNGKPAKIEARYVMRNLKEWDRFMRFMERYAEAYDLGFVKS
ncbi:unnamed protein product [Calypogeia fissa]